MADHNIDPLYKEVSLPPPPPPPRFPGATTSSSHSSVVPYNAATRQAAHVHGHPSLKLYNAHQSNYRHSSMPFVLGNMMQQGYPGPGNGYENTMWKQSQYRQAPPTPTPPVSQAIINGVVEKVRLEEQKKHREAVAKLESTIQGLTRELEESKASIKRQSENIQKEATQSINPDNGLEKSTSKSSTSDGGLKKCTEEAEVAEMDIPDIQEGNLQEEHRKKEKTQTNLEESEEKMKMLEEENAQLKKEIQNFCQEKEEVSQGQQSLTTGTQSLDSLQMKKNDADFLLRESEKKLEETKRTFNTKIEEISAKAGKILNLQPALDEEKKESRRDPDLESEIQKLQAALDEEKKKSAASNAQYMEQKEKSARLEQKLQQNAEEIQKKTNGGIVKVTRGVQTIRRDSESMDTPKRDVDVQTHPSNEQLLVEHNWLLNSRIRELVTGNTLLRGELREMRKSKGGKTPSEDDKKTDEATKSESEKRDPEGLVSIKDIDGSSSVKPVDEPAKPEQKKKITEKMAISKDCGKPDKSRLSSGQKPNGHRSFSVLANQKLNVKIQNKRKDKESDVVVEADKKKKEQKEEKSESSVQKSVGTTPSEDDEKCSRKNDDKRKEKESVDSRRCFSVKEPAAKRERKTDEMTGVDKKKEGKKANADTAITKVAEKCKEENEDSVEKQNKAGQKEGSSDKWRFLKRNTTKDFDGSTTEGLVRKRGRPPKNPLKNLDSIEPPTKKMKPIDGLQQQSPIHISS